LSRFLNKTKIKTVINRNGWSLTKTSLVYLDDEITNLQEKLKWLEEERAVWFRYQIQNNAILSPLCRMPLEILHEIFSSALPLIGDMRGSDMGQIPWLLTQISSHWRVIAICTSSLWSRIAIDYSILHLNILCP
jgi:protein gp37